MPEHDNDRPLVLITGISRGIGAATARLLTTAGCEVWGTGRSAIHPASARGWFPCDFTDLAAADRLIDDLRTSGRRIDLLIHNAAAISPRIDLRTGLAEGFLVNTVTPVAMTDALCRAGLLGGVIAVLAGSSFESARLLESARTTGLAGYFSNKEWLMQAHAHLAGVHAVPCWFYRPPSTGTQLQTDLLDAMAVARWRPARRLLEWINRAGLKSAAESAAPLAALAREALSSSGPGPLSIVRARRDQSPAAARLPDADALRRACQLALDTFRGHPA